MELTKEQEANLARTKKELGEIAGGICTLFVRAALVFWLYGIVGPLFSLPVLTYLQTLALVFMVRLLVLPRPSSERRINREAKA